jgi:hypothetical protein
MVQEEGNPIAWPRNRTRNGQLPGGLVQTRSEMTAFFSFHGTGAPERALCSRDVFSANAP